jgi:hypothetical protein
MGAVVPAFLSSLMVSAAEYPRKTQNLIAALVSVNSGITIITLMLRETFLFSLPCGTLVPEMTSKTTLLIRNDVA